MFTTLINGIKMVLRIALLIFITLTTIGLISNGITDNPYSSCKHHSYVDPATSKSLDCVTSGGKLYCDAEKHHQVLSDILGVLQKVSTLLTVLQELQQGDGVEAGTGIDKEETVWDEAGVKGVRVKKVEESVAAKPQNGSTVDGTFVVEL